jgi:hypothetical protein
MSLAATSLVHTVERLNWRAVRYTDEMFKPQWEGFVRVPGQRRLRSFATAQEADLFCSQQEESIRARVNPFACGGPALHYQTSLDADRLHDWLLDAGIEPPGPGGAVDWRAWWERTAPSLIPMQHAAVWQALDRVRFHQVVERPAGRSVYIITRREWDYNDEWYYPISSDGWPIEAYSTYEKAEAARARWERNERANWDEQDLEVTKIRWARLQPGEPLLPHHQDVFAEPNDDRLFYEVVEVEMGV